MFEALFYGAFALSVVGVVVYGWVLIPSPTAQDGDLDLPLPPPELDVPLPDFDLEDALRRGEVDRALELIGGPPPVCWYCYRAVPGVDAFAAHVLLGRHDG